MTTTSEGFDSAGAPDSHLIDQLARSFSAVEGLVSNVRPDQWSAPTPCSDWTVRQVIAHLTGMNRVFGALLANEPMPPRTDPPADADLLDDLHESSARLQAAFARPGVLGSTYRSPLGTTTGADRARIRLYDLLAHGWDLAQATGQPAGLPEDIAQACLAFARHQLRDEDRPGRFDPPRPSPRDASAVEQLVAFLGRSLPARAG
jgi:uncharacterized protein (TIGR03086 family)